MLNTLPVIVVPAKFIITHVVVPDDLIVTQKVYAGSYRTHSTATPEALYNIAERLIEELDAEARHIRSLGLFG